MKKVLISESVAKLLQEGYRTILSPSPEHKTFATILENQVPLWQDFGKDLAMKTFNLSFDELANIVGKSKKGSLNGFLNFYKIERAGFIPTGYRDLQNNPDTPALGFVVKDSGKTFGFNISADMGGLDVLLGNAFFITHNKGKSPDWRRHLKYFMDTGKKVLNSNVKAISKNYFDELGKTVGYKPELVLYVLRNMMTFFGASRHAEPWNFAKQKAEECDYLPCRLFLQFFNESSYNKGLEQMENMYPNIYDVPTVEMPNINDELNLLSKKITNIEKKSFESALASLELSYGEMTNDNKEYFDYLINNRIKSIGAQEFWDIINRYAQKIKTFLNNQKY